MAVKHKLPSTAVGRRRLLKLAALLMADAKKTDGIKFNLHTWGSTEDADAPIASCRTQACAIGLAGISGAFKRQGLSYRIHDLDIDVTLNGKCQRRGWRDGSFLNAKRFFHLTASQTSYLFIPDSYRHEGLPLTGAIAERGVAHRIRDFVAGRASP